MRIMRQSPCVLANETSKTCALLYALVATVVTVVQLSMPLHQHIDRPTTIQPATTTSCFFIFLLYLSSRKNIVMMDGTLCVRSTCVLPMKLTELELQAQVLALACATAYILRSTIWMESNRARICFVESTFNISFHLPSDGRTCCNFHRKYLRTVHANKRN